MTVRLPSLPVPRVKTTHMCMVFDLPDGDFHIVGTIPYRDNKIVLHHVMVFGCNDGKDPEHGVGEVYECPLAFDPACRDYISAWVHGVGGECLPDMIGIRVGSQGYRKAGIQLHWENQDLLPDLYDGSGVTLYFTPKLRQFDSGIMITGTDDMVIPPGQVAHTEVGHCYSECTERKFKQDIHIVGVINHMHYIGTDMKIEQLRNDTVIKVITDEHNYIYDHPTPYMFDPPVTIRPGDELRSTCIFDSSKRDNTTRAGWGYLDEMCYGFMIFYPKQAIRQPNGCTSWKSIPHCRFEMDPTVHDCDFKNVRNMSHAPTRAIYDNVMKYCKPYGPCYEECRNVVKEITTLPCYNGIMWEWQRDRIVGPFDDSNYFLDEDLTLKWNQFNAAVDLCSIDIQNERGNQTAWTNSASTDSIVTSALITSTLFAILMII